MTDEADTITPQNLLNQQYCEQMMTLEKKAKTGDTAAEISFGLTETRKLKCGHLFFYPKIMRSVIKRKLVLPAYCPRCQQYALLEILCPDMIVRQIYLSKNISDTKKAFKKIKGEYRTASGCAHYKVIEEAPPQSPNPQWQPMQDL